MKKINTHDEFYQFIPNALKRIFRFKFFFEHFFGGLLTEQWSEKWSLSIQNRIYEALESKQGQVFPLDEFHADVSENTFKEYIRKGMPFIIRNGAKNWEALKQWDFDFFSDHYGDHPVLLSNHKELGDPHSGQAELTDLREIIKGLDHQSTKYARFNPLLDVHPELQDYLDQSWLSKRMNTNLMKYHVLFIGGKGTRTRIHNAATENIFIQIRGSKRWIMWNPKAIYILNPKVNRGPAKSSDYDPLEMQKHLHTSFVKLPRFEVDIHEGDLLYIPSYFWHHVQNLTKTIGVGARWLSPINVIKNEPLLASLELFNTSPSVFSIWKKNQVFDFNKIMLKNSNTNHAEKTENN